MEGEIKQEDKREQILLAARRLLAKKDFHRIKIDEVAREAGIAKGTVYLYFKNKEEVFSALFENLYRQGIGILEEAAWLKGDFSERIETFVRKQTAFFKDNLDLLEMMGQRPEVFFRDLGKNVCQKLGKEKEKCVQIFSRIMKQGVREKKLRKISPDLAAVFFLAMCHALINRSIVQRRVKVKEIEKNILDLFLKGVGK